MNTRNTSYHCLHSQQTRPPVRPPRILPETLPGIEGAAAAQPLQFLRRRCAYRVQATQVLQHYLCLRTLNTSPPLQRSSFKKKKTSSMHRFLSLDLPDPSTLCPQHALLAEPNTNATTSSHYVHPPPPRRRFVSSSSLPRQNDPSPKVHVIL